MFGHEFDSRRLHLVGMQKNASDCKNVIISRLHFNYNACPGKTLHFLGVLLVTWELKNPFIMSFSSRTGFLQYSAVLSTLKLYISL